MSEIFFTSDPHFCHDRDFVYKARGFNSIEEHDEAIIRNWNEIVAQGDTVYMFGDLMMSADRKGGLEKLSRLNGKIILVRGNHDTDAKFNDYLTCSNVCAELSERDVFAKMIKVGKWSFLLSHWPTMVGDTIHGMHSHKFFCLHGHTHSKERFQFLEHGCYNVGMDAHNCRPVNVKEIQRDIIEEMDRRRKEAQNDTNQNN